MAIEKKEPPEAPIHGDVLQAVLSFVPLVDLLPVCHVSKAWNAAVSLSLRCVNTIKPWLLVHTQSTRSPYSTTTYAYDPRSLLWMEIKRMEIKNVSVLQSSHSNLLYVLSPSRFSFSFDPLHLTWHHADAPLVWRKDPIVAVVGNYAVVAGGACDFEDDPLAVEIYDFVNRTWETCDYMPATLKDSVASTWLSVAVDNRKMFVTEKVSGVTYSLDPISKTWYGPFDLRPDEDSYFSVIGFANNRLIMVSLEGTVDDLKTVRLLEVEQESMKCREIGEMPRLLVEKLQGEIGGGGVSAVAITSMGDFAYIHNPSEPAEVVVCEVVNGGCRWGSVRNVVARDGTTIMQRMIFTCSNVGLGDLRTAIFKKISEY